LSREPAGAEEPRGGPGGAADTCLAAPPLPSDAEDLAAIRAVLAGDREAFRGLVDRHAKSILNLAYRMTGNAADAEDLTQESFLQAYARLRDFRPGARFHPWIYTIALNLCRSHLRRRTLRRWLMPEPPREPEHQAPPEPRAPAPDPEQALLGVEAERCLAEAVAALPAKYREVFVLRQSRGMRYEEIAERLGLPLGTVEARLFRARRRVLDQLQAGGFRAAKAK
jgi:RNA polymerase sigma-70 factor (ECF subfamily)